LFSSSGVHRCLPSFPTRRSSDLDRGRELVSRHFKDEFLATLAVGLVCRNRHPSLLAGLHAEQCILETRYELAGAECHLEWISPADRKSTRLNSSHVKISYAVFCL